MQSRSINGPLWAGLALSLAAMISYPFFFVRWPQTRDFPWANLLLFALAGWLLWKGVRRVQYARETEYGSGRFARFGAAAAVTIGVLAFALLAVVYFTGRMLPVSREAPQIGQAAPEFTLPDSSGHPVSLTELRRQSIEGKAPRGVLLVFYRGYW